MKFFIAIALIATVASAAYIKPTVVSGEMAEIQEIIAAINSPSTNPATAAALEQMLLDALGVNPEPIAVGPAIIPEPIAVGPVIIPAPAVAPEPISIGPAMVDFPMPDGGVATAPVVPVAPVVVPSPSPVVVGPIASGAPAPLVQIILNINQASTESAVVAPAPAVVAEAVQPEPVHVVESAAEPVQVVESAPIPVEPVQVVEVAPEPVQVIEVAPVPVEPVIIGTPILPSPAVVLPEELN